MNKGLKQWREEIEKWHEPRRSLAKAILRDAEYDLMCWPQHSRKIVKDAIECFLAISAIKENEDTTNDEA